MDLDSLIISTKDLIGSIIQKPKMSEKLLSKPPFRFLHDTITAITNATGFGEGLYNEAELDSAKITDKDSKVAYLQKIFNLVGICRGSPVNISALKVVAGAEPEKTNAFLTALAEASQDASIDNSEAVARCLRGEEPGSGSIPRKSKQSMIVPQPAEAKTETVITTEPSAKSTVRASEVSADTKTEAKTDNNVVAERGRSRGGTRGGKPNQATTDIGLTRESTIPNHDKEIEKCDGSIETTQQMFSDLITKPKLTEKLLSKPPFRFLFDIVMEVIRVTDFAKDLYNDDEMNSANITEKQQKLTFLQKIIKVVGYQLNTIVVAQPIKIIAGQDAENTNIFLQQLAVAAKLVPNSNNAVKTVLDELGGGNPSNLELTSSKPIIQPSMASEPKESGRGKIESSSDRKEIQAVTSSNSNEAKTMATGRGFDASSLNIESTGNDNDSDQKRSARPTTARRRPPKVKDTTADIVQPTDVGERKKTEGILIDGQNDDDDDNDLVADGKRLADEFTNDGSKNSTASNAVTGAESKLVKGILSRQAEQDAAAAALLQKNNDANDESKSSASDDTKGSGIRIGKLRKTGDKKSALTSSVNGPATSTLPNHQSTFSESDIERLRSATQVLVQHTGPLGTCMDFIQEDVSLMTAELHKWEAECRRDEALLASEKMKTREILQPLQAELSDIEEQIRDQIAKISALKSSIAKNDDSVNKVLKLVAST